MSFSWIVHGFQACTPGDPAVPFAMKHRGVTRLVVLLAAVSYGACFVGLRRDTSACDWARGGPRSTWINLVMANGMLI